MADIGWVRSLGNRAEGQGLRRGAWYRIVEDPRKDWVVGVTGLLHARDHSGFA